MKIIVKQAVEKFANQKDHDDKKILDFIKAHPYYDSALPSNMMVGEIREKLKSQSSQVDHIYRKIQQLSLYLKRDTNKLIFQIYEFILRNPRGVTYKDIQKKTGLEIVNISHYCCRLRKMNFVELHHQKSQKVVSPKAETGSYQYQNDEEALEKQQKPFFFHQLSMADNIWVNVSSVDSYQKNGVTNEEIKGKLRKASETKLIMKLVEQVKEMYKFDRQMVSQGKVFEHKYKNFTEKVIQLADERKNQYQVDQKLNENIQKWLKKKFPNFKSQNFLLEFINQQLRSYFSANGTKTARRACTPIKLIRYIKILNSLNKKWPQTHNELKKFIIEEQKQIPNNGIMHKRSIVGILDGLVEKKILRNQDEYYYPEWDADEQKKIQRQYDQEIQNLPQYRPRKKAHLSSITQPDKKGSLMTVKDYRKQMKNQLMIEELKELVKIRLRAGFKRILYARRKKVEVQIYEPQKHILHLLQDPTYSFPTLNPTSYDDFLNKIDEFVQENGKKQQGVNVGSDITRIFKRYPNRKDEYMKMKIGANWGEKIEPLLQQCVQIDGKEVRVRSECDRFFI